MKPIVAALSLILALAVNSSANAQVLLNFDFTINNLYADVAGGDTTGSFTGEIFGLDSSGISTPDSITLTSAPADDPLTTPLSFSITSGSFTVSNDTITAGAITGLSSDGNWLLALNSYASFNSSGWSLSLSSGLLSGVNGLVPNEGSGIPIGVDYSNQGGFAGTTYTLDASSAPEPSTWALLLGVLGLLGICRRGLRA